MTTRTFGYALGLCAAAAALTACGAAQPAGVTPGAMQQSRTSAMFTDRNESWMLQQSKGHKSILIYAGGVYGSIYIYDYFTGKQVGKLNINAGYGACVDAKGDVFIGQSDATTLEYAHGGTKVLNAYSTAGISDGCSVDAKNDLAITNEGNVTVFAGAIRRKARRTARTIAAICSRWVTIPRAISWDLRTQRCRLNLAYCRPARSP